MRRSIDVGRLYACWGVLNSHNHFAKAGETWTQKWKPSQPRPVRWQLVRGEGLDRKPLIWILWLYQKDGSAIYVEFGRKSIPQRYIIGLPGWRFYFGRDWMNPGYKLCWNWRLRENREKWSYQHHFIFWVTFGRTHEAVLDFGGPWWCPRLMYRWAYAWEDAWPSSRWTGMKREVVDIDWPRLQFSFIKIPDDANG